MSAENSFVDAQVVAAEYVLIGDLVPWKKNPKDHTAAAIARIVASITAFGFGAPIIARKANREIIAGHRRYSAAQELGLTHVPVRYLDLDEEKAHILALADNRLNEDTATDEALLSAVLADLKNEGADLAAAGFDERELHRLLADVNAPIDDEVPPLPDVAITQPGDLYVLGRHRLLCGDSTKPEDMARLMASDVATLCFTDPPYNADYSSRVDKDRRKPWGGIANDNMSEAAFAAFLADAFDAIKQHLATDASVYVWTDWKRYPLVASVFADAFLHKGTIIWNKECFGLGTFYRTQHEFCLFGCNGERVGIWLAEHDECDVWSVPRDSRSTYEHPTQKPVELSRRAMVNSSRLGDIVVDAFGGSGSTVMSAEATGRAARVMELDPKYCDVIVQRWERMTGAKAEAPR